MSEFSNQQATGDQSNAVIVEWDSNCPWQYDENRSLTFKEDAVIESANIFANPSIIYNIKNAKSIGDSKYQLRDVVVLYKTKYKTSQYYDAIPFAPYTDIIIVYRDYVGTLKQKKDYNQHYAVTEVEIGYPLDLYRYIAGCVTHLIADQSEEIDKMGERISGGYVWTTARVKNYTPSKSSENEKNMRVEIHSKEYREANKSFVEIVDVDESGNLVSEDVGSLVEVMSKQNSILKSMSADEISRSHFANGAVNMIGSGVLSFRLKHQIAPNAIKKKYTVGVTLNNFNFQNYTAITPPSNNIVLAKKHLSTKYVANKSISGLFKQMAIKGTTSQSQYSTSKPTQSSRRPDIDTMSTASTKVGIINQGPPKPTNLKQAIPVQKGTGRSQPNILPEDNDFDPMEDDHISVDDVEVNRNE